MVKNKKNKNKKKVEKEDYGSVEFYCKHCDYTFEIDWETIWDIQECTHGYVGYHLNDTFISCPKCDKICGDEEDEVIPKVKRAVHILSDDDLPF
jgi:Fe2+ or Zn2+ uptake regulation protein